MTRQEAEQRLTKFKQYKKRYQGYPGSPGDDCLLGLYGYTVREERGYINRVIKCMNAALKEMDRKGVDSLTDREIYYLVY